MDLMRLFLRISRIARTPQPFWKLVVIGLGIALFLIAALIEHLAWRPVWLVEGKTTRLRARFCAPRRVQELQQARHATCLLQSLNVALNTRCRTDPLPSYIS